MKQQKLNKKREDEMEKYVKRLLDSGLLSFNYSSSSIGGQLTSELFNQFKNYEINVSTALEILDDLRRLILLTSHVN